MTVGNAGDILSIYKDGTVQTKLTQANTMYYMLGPPAYYNGGGVSTSGVLTLNANDYVEAYLSTGNSENIARGDFFIKRL